jgi:hypothetical protein
MSMRMLVMMMMMMMVMMMMMMMMMMMSSRHPCAPATCSWSLSLVSRLLPSLACRLAPSLASWTSATNAATRDFASCSRDCHNTKKSESITPLDHRRSKDS